MPDDRDKRNTIKPPSTVQAQIAAPLKKSRAATPVEFAAIDFEREPTAVAPIPTRGETPDDRMRRQVAQTKNLNVEQLDELAWLREQLTAFLDDERKSREAWRNFLVKAGALILLAGGIALGVVKLSGCGG